MKTVHFGKKQIITAVMVLLLGGAVYLNYYTSSVAPSATATSTTEETTQTTSPTELGDSQFVNNTTAVADAFAAARLERENAREEALAILKDTLQDASLSEDLTKEAVAKAADIAKRVEQESAVENLVKTKGFEDCVVYIAEEACHVTIKASELTDEQALQITQIVLAQTDVLSTNVHIITAQ